MTPRLPALCLALVVLTGCGQHPVRHAWEHELLVADRAFDQGRLDDAEAAYEDLAARTQRPSDLRYLRFQRAWIAEKRGAGARALRAYEAMWATGEKDEYAARSVYRAGRVLLDHFGDPARAAQVWERLIASRPHRAVADRAMFDLLNLRDEAGDPLGAIHLLDRLYGLVHHTNMADNILYEMARRLRAENYPAAAEVAYLRMLERHPDTGLSDDARWHLAELLVERGELERALVQLKLLTEDRDSSWQVGIYESALADDARFWRGILLFQAGDAARAEREFRRLYRDFPNSILRDDARFNVAVCRAVRGEADAARDACNALARTEPESRWVARCAERAGAGRLATPGLEAFVARGVSP